MTLNDSIDSLQSNIDILVMASSILKDFGYTPLSKQLNEVILTENDRLNDLTDYIIELSDKYDLERSEYD